MRYIPTMPTATGTATVTLDSLYAVVTKVAVVAGGTNTTVTVYSLAGGTIVPGTPTATEVQFTGSPDAPSNTLTFGTAPAAGDLILVLGVQDGDAE